LSSRPFGLGILSEPGGASRCAVCLELKTGEAALRLPFLKKGKKGEKEGSCKEIFLLAREGGGEKKKKKQPPQHLAQTRAVNESKRGGLPTCGRNVHCRRKEGKRGKKRNFRFARLVMPSRRGGKKGKKSTHPIIQKKKGKVAHQKHTPNSKKIKMCLRREGELQHYFQKAPGVTSGGGKAVVGKRGRK